MNQQQMEQMLLAIAQKVGAATPIDTIVSQPAQPVDAPVPPAGVYFRRKSGLTNSPGKRQNVRLRLEVVDISGDTQDFDHFIREVADLDSTSDPVFRETPAYEMGYTLVHYADTVDGALKRLTHKSKWAVN